MQLLTATVFCYWKFLIFFMSESKKLIKLSQTALCCKWHAFSLWCMLCHKKGVLNAFLLGDAYLFWQTNQPPGCFFATELILHLIHYLIRCEKSILSHKKSQALFHYKDVAGSITDLLAGYTIVSERPSYMLMNVSNRPVGKTLETLVLKIIYFKGKYKMCPL